VCRQGALRTNPENSRLDRIVAMAHHGQDDQPHRRRQGDALDAKIGFDQSDLKQEQRDSQAEWNQEIRGRR